MQQTLSDTSSLIRVLIVAQSVVMQAGLAALINTSPTMEVIGQATIAALAAQIEHLQPDVVLMEWDATEAEFPPLLSPQPELNPVAIVVLLDDWSQSVVTELLRAGVQGVLPNGATASELVAAIESAAIGLTVLHPTIVDALLPGLPATIRPLPTDAQQSLTTREIEVLGMLAEGLGNKTIARRLSISEHTVKFHIGSIFSKLNASSRTEAVILGARQGLVLL